jgi:glutathione peroxidase
MNPRSSIGFIAGAAGLALLSVCRTAAADCPEFLNQDLRKLRSAETVNVCQVSAGKPMLIINTASHCGFTPQFKGLEALHQEYKDRGLVVLGFPSNDFNQEAKDEAETAEVCFINYGVTFTMFSPISVKGEAAHPIFKELARQTEAPGWNFNKYIVRPDGTVVRHFDSKVAPDAAELRHAIESVL